MRPTSLGLAAAFAALGLPAVLCSQTVTFGGQVRPRYEFRDPAGNGRDEFTSMRVRASLTAEIEPGLTVFIQGQDVRIWGQETNTLTDFTADHVDLHQGYLRYRGQELEWLQLTLGRMETNFGGQRLVGAVGWTQQGRSFDGIRADLGGSSRTVSLIGYTLADATADTHEVDAGFYGAYAVLGDLGPGALDLYWLFNRDEAVEETEQSTFGARYAFARGALTGRFEGSLQRGDRGGRTVSAWMFGGRLGTALFDGRLNATLWYDHLSGDEDPGVGDVETFSTLFATNHKFYGLADLFLDIPAHTGGRGLQDLALKLSAGPWGDDTRLGADLHSFRASEDAGLSTAHFADELDLTVSHRYSPHLGVSAGVSFVFQDDALAEIGRLAEDMTWVWVMFDASF